MPVANVEAIKSNDVFYTPIVSHMFFRFDLANTYATRVHCFQISCVRVFLLLFVCIAIINKFFRGILCCLVDANERRSHERDKQMA